MATASSSWASKLYLFDRTKLRNVTIRPGRIMPSDYDRRLSPEEFRGLLAFLTRQGQVSSPARGTE